MASYRMLNMKYQNDPYVETLSMESRYLYMNLFTCIHTDNLGVLEITPKRIAMEWSMREEDVIEGLNQLEADGKLIRDGYTMFLTKFIKNQATQSPKLLIGLAKLYDRVQSGIIRKAIARLYPQILNTPPCPHGNYSSAQGVEGTVHRPRPASTASTNDRVSIPSVEEEVEKKKENISKGYQARVDGKPSPMPQRVKPHAVLPTRPGASSGRKAEFEYIPAPSGMPRKTHSPAVVQTLLPQPDQSGAIALAREFRQLREFYNEHIRHEGYIDGYREFMAARCYEHDLPDFEKLKAAISQLGQRQATYCAAPLLADFIRERLWKEVETQAAGPQFDPQTRSQSGPTRFTSTAHPVSLTPPAALERRLFGLVRTMGHELHTGIENFRTPPPPSVLMGA